MPSCDSGIVDHSGKKLSEEDVKECVVQLRELLDADKKFQNFRKDELYLLRFLHCTAFNVHQAYRRADDFLNLISDYPDWFATDSPLQAKDLIEQNTRFILPDVRDNDGRRIFISRMGALDTSKMSIPQSVQVDEYWLELVMDEPETQSAGISVVMDMNGYSWNVFKWLTPTNIRIGSKKVDLYPCKELVYHVVNTSMLVNASVKLVWPFLSSKVKQKFHFHFDNWDSLHKHIKPEILPPSYGGTGPEFNIQKINQWLYDNNDEIAERLKHQNIIKATAQNK